MPDCQNGDLIVCLSSNLIEFDETKTQFDHLYGRFVKFNSSLIVIGGEGSDDWGFICNAQVEERQGKNWSERPDMSPVNGLTCLTHFTAVPIGNNLYIFGKIQQKSKSDNLFILGGKLPYSDTLISSSVLKWNGSSWAVLENTMRRNLYGHESIFYEGEILHFGGCTSEDCNNIYRLISIHLTHLWQKKT